MTWRARAGFAGAGCAAALAYRGDWWAGGVAGAWVLLRAVLWVRGEFAATRRMLHGLAGMSEMAAALPLSRARAGRKG